MSSMSKKMKIVFTASVLLNVVLAGLAGGSTYKHWRDDNMRRMELEMSPEGRNIVARTMQKAFTEGKPRMDEARAIKKEIKSILSAQQFDADAFEAQAQKLHEVMSDMGHKRIDVTKELASQLSASDRKILAEKFSKGFHGHDKSRGDKDRPHAFLKDQERVPKGISGELPPPDMPEDMPPQPE